jgi:hypothetical protein
MSLATFNYFLSFKLIGELLCYVHNVKPVQKSGKINYVTCQLQTKSSMEKAICFSPEKITPLKAAMASKSPIKMKNFEYNKQYNNIVIKKSTSIENPGEGVLDFQIQDLQASSVLIKDINTIPQGELITVKENRCCFGTQLVQLKQYFGLNGLMLSNLIKCICSQILE